jgi:hypothetical protein
MADGHRRVEETVEAFERSLAAKFARLVAEETQPLRAELEASRAALEASKSECEALRKRAAELEACLASRLAEETPAMPGLPNHLVVAHILRSDFLPEPGNLAVLRAVSKGMRAAVDATGREIKKLSNLEAAELGDVSLLKDRHSRGLLGDEYLLCAAAARNGDLEALKALRADKWPWDKKTCAHAARGGHLKVLKWLRANGCSWDEWTCAFAAENGDLEMLEWARENGCPWNGWTCAYAAWGGHLETLQWARENGCPWDEWTCSHAAKRGHLEVLKWARENGCP